MPPRATRSQDGGPSQNTRPRQRVSYRELDELSDEDPTELNTTSVRRQIHTPTRRSQRASGSRPSYNEPPTDSSSESSEGESGEESRRPIRRARYSPRKQITSPNSNKRPASSNTDQSKPSPAKKRKREQPIASQPLRKSVTHTPVSFNHPPWQTLPYHILRQIFGYASYPLYESALRPSQSIYWLLDTSRLCRTFHEAAIAALVLSPPLYPAYRARDLLRILKKSQDTLSLNYQTKIQHLDVEVKHLLIKKRPIDLPEIIKRSPLLKDLRLYHKDDEAGATLWSRPSAKSLKWDYDPAIFDALDQNNIVLRNFEWNGRFPSSNKVVEDMAQWHKRPAFQKLESLTLVNLSTSEKELEQEEGKYETILMEAVAMLPSVKRLTFKNCTIVNDRLIRLLSIGLQSLTMVDCVSLTSAELGAFLFEKGNSIAELVLDSNQSLNMAFTDNLAACCPHLQTFKMDLTYHDASAYHDVEPYFDELLPTGPPSWPSSLQTIDLAQLRSWDMSAADGFLQSLANAAPDLPNLRFLSLKAILKSGWRDRADLRKKWKDRLEKIFLREWHAPEDNRTVKLQGIVDGSTQLGDTAMSMNGEMHVKEDRARSFSREASTSAMFPNLTLTAEPSSRPSTSSSNDSDQNGHRKSLRIPVVSAQKEEQLRREAEIAAAEEEKALARKEAFAAAKRAVLEKQKEEERVAAIAQKEAEKAARREERTFEKEGRLRLRSRFVTGERKAEASTSTSASTIVDAQEKDDQKLEHEDDVPFVQGLCTTVLFRVDDQRPADAQFNEGDFVDEEMSGDEDWNGVDVDFEEEWVKRHKVRRKYAW